MGVAGEALEFEDLVLPPSRRRYRRVPVFDNKSQSLSPFLEGCLRFIDEGRAAGSVLVHCFHGVSRSVSVVAAYLMSRQRRSLDDALAVVRAVRPQAKPSDTFMRELESFERSLGLAGPRIPTAPGVARTAGAATGGGRSLGAPVGPALPPGFSRATSSEDAERDEEERGDGAAPPPLIGPARPPLGPSLPPASRKRDRDPDDESSAALPVAPALADPLPESLAPASKRERAEGAVSPPTVPPP